MDITWADAQTFLAVAEQRSFSAAARILGVGQPTISRRIAGLETRLACALFTRGKLGSELTEAGARLLPAAEQMARWAGEFSRLAQGSEDRPAGRVRIAAPPGLAVEVIAPLAAVARERLPEIRLEVLASVDYVDLPRGDADLAIRIREAQEPELTTIHTASLEIGIFGTADYVARLHARLAAEGRSPGEIGLGDLDWITWSFPYEEVAPRPMLERAIENFAPAFASDNYLVLKRALAEGMGVMPLEKRGLHRSTGSSPGTALVEIDLGFSLAPSSYFLVCAKSMQYVPRVRAIAELLTEYLERNFAE
jgi:DNA-binding transcriptional LysR family regulator